MVKKFNLLELHDKKVDQKPFSWICFDLNHQIKDILKNLIQEVSLNFRYKKQLINHLKNELNCSYDLIESYINFRKDWFAIPVLLELFRFNKNTFKLINEINANIKYLKNSGPTSRKIIAVKSLNEDLCEIAGAHAADGTLPLRINIIFKTKPSIKLIKLINQKFNRETKICYDSSIYRYYLTICSNEQSIEEIYFLVNKSPCFERLKVSYFFRITDYHKDSLELINENITNNFGIKYSLRKFKGVNAWTLTIANKIIVRYLIKFLGFKHGSKTNFVRIPNIIKNSSMSFQDAFVRGFLQFDGSVELDGNINLQTKSENMVLDLTEYLNKRGIVFSSSNKRDKRDCFTLKIRRKRNIDLSFLFFNNSTKQQLLTRKFNYQPINRLDAITRLNEFSNQNMSINLGDFMDLFSESKTLYCLKIKEIHLGTLQKYANFLIDCNILCRYRYGKAYKYRMNNNLKEWRIPKND